MFKLSFLNMLFSLFLIPLMMQCDNGGNDPCDMYTNYATEPDLIITSPLKKNYQKGETVKLKFSAPSKMKVDSKPIDIFHSTKQTSAVLSINLSELFKDNTVTVVKGQKSDDQRFSPVYDSAKDSYELEINVVLNRQGIYSFDSSASFRDKDFEDGNCVFIFLTTTIKGSNSDNGRLEFTVN